MKTDRQELENNLVVILTLYNEDQTVKDAVADILKKNNNIDSGITKSWLNSPIAIKTISELELCLFVDALFETTKEEKIKTDKYFNDEEIRQSKTYFVENEDNSGFLILTNVDQLSENQFVCSKRNYSEIYKDFSHGLVQYNESTQRSSKRIKFGDTIIKTPDIRPSVVNSITEKMLAHQFIPNAITYNIRKTGLEKFEYDVKNRTLTIEIDNKGSFVDIIDGAHRCVSMCRVISVNPKHDGYTIINIFNFTESKAQSFIAQEAIHTPIHASLRAAFENDNENISFTKEVIQEGNKKNNVLFGALAEEYSELRIDNSKFTSIDIFSKAFNYNFKIEEPRDYLPLKKWIISFFNELIGQLREQELEGTNAFHPYIFVGYVALASELQNDDNWIEKLTKVIKEMDFKSDKIWTNIGITSTVIGTLKQPTITKISKYFRGLI